LQGNKRLEAMDLFQNFKQLPYNFWNKVLEVMPIEWQTSEINEIQTHITQILDNFELFKTEITTKLWRL
jgi:flagellin-specific chaperone FliS